MDQTNRGSGLTQLLFEARIFFNKYQNFIVSIGVIVFLAYLLIEVYTQSGNDAATLQRTVAGGLYQGMLYFMVAAGLSIIFGLMDVLNFAQGGLFMLGAYIGFDVLTSLPQEATTDSRLMTIYVMINAPLIVLGIQALLQPRLEKRGIDIPLKLRGSFTRNLAVIMIFGVPLGYVLGTNFADSSNADQYRVIVAILVMVLVSIEHVSQALYIIAKGSSEFLYAQVIVRGTEFFSQALPGQVGVSRSLSSANEIMEIPKWEPIEPYNEDDIISVMIFAAATALFSLLLLQTSTLVIRLGLAGLAALFAGAVVGVLMERIFIRPTYSRPFFQIVLTFGLALVLREAIVYEYGREGLGTLREFLPGTLTGVIEGTTIFNYWVFMIVMGLIMMVTVQLLLQRTRIGIIIRAGVQDSEMVEALGINVRLVFTAVFALGASIAALGGIISAGFLNIDPGLGDFFLLQAIAVVIVGGLGSYAGTAVASIMIGIVRQAAAYLSRQRFDTDGFAPIAVLIILCVILIIKPSGLYGKEH